jgi:methyl-accepting chemotaxis protein
LQVHEYLFIMKDAGAIGWRSAINPFFKRIYMKTSGLSLAQRLSLSFAAVIALLALLAILASNRIEGLNGATELIVNDRYPKTHIANEVKSQINVVSNSMLNVLIMADESQIAAEIEKIGQVAVANDASIADLDRILTDAKGRELLKDIVKIRDRFRPLRESFIALINEGKKEEAQVKYLFSIRTLQKKYFAALDAFVNYQDSQMKAAGENSVVVLGGRCVGHRLRMAQYKKCD